MFSQQIVGWLLHSDSICQCGEIAEVIVADQNYDSEEMCRRCAGKIPDKIREVFTYTGL